MLQINGTKTLVQEAEWFFIREHCDFYFPIAYTVRWRSIEPWIWDIPEFILRGKWRTISMNYMAAARLYAS